MFTSINLICGCLGIIEVFEGRLANVAYYIWIAGLVDFLDGYSARLMDSSSLIGKDLDSLADLVSFGVLPSLLSYALLREFSTIPYLPYLAILIAVFSALRLAKFNNDERQSDTFYGLPTPANALFFSSLPLLLEQGSYVHILQNEYIFSVIIIIFSVLLVSEIKLMAFKFKKFQWAGNQVKILFILFGLMAIIFFQVIAIPYIIVMYILISLITNFMPGKI